MPVKRLAGTAGVPPAMSAKRENLLRPLSEELRACGAFAGGSSTPPDKKHLLGTPPARGPSQTLDHYSQKPHSAFCYSAASLP